MRNSVIAHNNHTFVVIVVFVMIFCSVASTHRQVNADVVDLMDEAQHQCKPGETEVWCNFTYKKGDIFGPTRATDECKSYANDPDYYMAYGEGHSLGGRDRYCKKDYSRYTYPPFVAPTEKKTSTTVPLIVAGVVSLVGIVGLVFLWKRTHGTPPVRPQ